MSGPGFSLLNLPEVALLKVFNYMTPLQLWDVANKNPCCEKLAKQVKFNITDFGADRTSIWIDYEPSQSDNYQFGSFKTSEEEWRSTVSSVSKFLGQSFSTLIVKTEDIEASWAWIHNDHRDVKWLELKVKNEEDPQKVMKTILKNGELKRFDVLYLNLDTSESFKYSDHLIFDKAMENLVLQSSPWLTVQNIVECNVKKLDVNKSSFRDDDLNSLLKNWVREEVRSKNSELSRTVKIKKSDKQKIDLNVLLNGLHHEIRYHFTSKRFGESFCFWWNDDHDVTVSVKEHTLLITCGSLDQQ